MLNPEKFREKRWGVGPENRRATHMEVCLPGSLPIGASALGPGCTGGDTVVLWPPAAQRTGNLPAPHCPTQASPASPSLLPHVPSSENRSSAPPPPPPHPSCLCPFSPGVCPHRAPPPVYLPRPRNSECPVLTRRRCLRRKGVSPFATSQCI